MVLLMTSMLRKSLLRNFDRKVYIRLVANKSRTMMQKVRCAKCMVRYVSRSRMSMEVFSQRETMARATMLRADNQMSVFVPGCMLFGVCCG